MVPNFVQSLEAQVGHWPYKLYLLKDMKFVKSGFFFSRQWVAHEFSVAETTDIAKNRISKAICAMCNNTVLQNEKKQASFVWLCFGSERFY